MIAQEPQWHYFRCFTRKCLTGLKLESQEPDPEKMLENNDAALIIGDQALGYSREGALIYDLSEEWFNRTGKTFVHAVIAVRQGVEVEFTQTLMDAKQEGMQNLDAIAETQAKKTGHPVSLLQDYLKNKIRYDFGEEELKGLVQFQSLCHEVGLLPEKFPLKFIWERTSKTQPSFFLSNPTQD